MSLEDKLRGWTGPSSTTEQEKQERAERMVRQAVSAHKPFEGYDFRVYAKGSYANNTNVRSDSDVDIAVRCAAACYAEEHTKGAHTPGGAYTGIWTPSKLRTELAAAMEAKFSGQVDTSGSTAIRVNANTARVDADVVPCFNYRYYFSPTSWREGARVPAFRYLRYDTPDRRNPVVGSKVFKKSHGSIVNYPQQQLDNGRAKDRRTNGRYKELARALKNGENALVTESAVKPKPSYFMECLAYNVPDQELRYGWSKSAWMQMCLAWLHNNLLASAFQYENWVEPNELKYLFTAGNKWSLDDGRELIAKLWDYLGFE